MYTYFIYLIVVLLIFLTYRPPAETNFSLIESVVLFLLSTLVFAIICRSKFQVLQRRFFDKSLSRLDHQFSTCSMRLTIMAIILFTLDIYLLDLPSFLLRFSFFRFMPTLLALLFLLVFFFYLALIWYFAHPAYQRIYLSNVSRKAYIRSNISIAAPFLLPWFLLSGVADIIQLLPYRWSKAFLETTEGQFAYFFIFLFAVALVGPGMIQKFWRCRPVENGYYRKRIEALSQQAGLKFENILYWPVFEGKMITAGVMGLVKKFRYILVSKAIFRFLEPAEIDAVIAHEIGHVKKNHLIFSMLFFAGYMLLTYATFDLILFFILYSEPVFLFFSESGLNQTVLTSILHSLILILTFIVYFRFIFGYFIRNFERQADIYVYTLFENAQPLISTLQKIAITSGLPADKPNWHHFSIQERINYLKKCENDRRWISRHHRKIKKSIAVYLGSLLLIGFLGYQLNYGETGMRMYRHLNEKRLLKGIEKNPDSRWINDTLSLSISILSREMEKDPDNPLVKSTFFSITKILSRGIEMHPNHPKLYALLGDLYYAANDDPQVQKAYETSLNLQPDNPHVLNNLAWLYATSKDPEIRNPKKALELAKVAVLLKKSPYILDTLAESYYANGMYAEAVEMEKQALSFNPENRAELENQLKKFNAALTGK